MKAIVVHGGAGKWKPDKLKIALKGVEDAVMAGWKAMETGNALDAVIAAVSAMEDNPVFNAGTGSTLNLFGEVEPEASVMRGDTMEAGGVSGPRVKNPVQLARLVMEKTDHVILVGHGARLFAEAMGFREQDLVVEERKKIWRDMLQRLRDGREIDHWTKLQTLIKQHPEFTGDTVGAVAVDENGLCAAATSTGGVSLKLPGRMGDSPVPGAGNYACRAGAVSATGEGEGMLRSFAAGFVAELMAQGTDVESAVRAGVKRVESLTGKACGIIAVDENGGTAAHKNTPFMPHAIMKQGFDDPVVNS